MNTSTDKLIKELSRGLQPVRPLRRPSIRTAKWLAILFPYVTIVLLVMATMHDSSAHLSDSRFLLEQGFALATGIAAVMAAFASVIPGERRRVWMGPVLPLIGWLGTLGEGCVRAGLAGISLHHDLSCFPYLAMLGTAPGVVLWIMLRQGAPITPHLTAALGALGAAGLGNFCVRLGHPEEVTVMLLVWHAGGVLLLAALTSLAGRRLLNWRSVTASARTTDR